MIDFVYNGINYRLVKDTQVFRCVNVLYMGVMFIEQKRYKKYVNSNGTIYLVEY